MSHLLSFAKRRATLGGCILSLAVLGACSSVRGQQSLGSLEAARTERGSTGSFSSIITGADLQEVQALSTLDAIQRLHPEFLRASSRAENRDTASPAVYVDHLYVGDVSWLALIPAPQIRTITFLHPAEAHLQFGATCVCGSGVLLVATSTP
jgi:hypothetical protein